MSDDAGTTVIGQVAAGAGMSTEQAVAYMLIGDQRHSDAPDSECGAVDPRRDMEDQWCQRPNDGRCKREGWHCCYRLDEDYRRNQ